MRKICVFTGSRAEYGLLLCVMREIQASEDLRLQIQYVEKQLNRLTNVRCATSHRGTKGEPLAFRLLGVIYEICEICGFKIQN